MAKSKGWRNESGRHSLAARGLHTKRHPSKSQTVRKLKNPKTFVVSVWLPDGEAKNHLFSTKRAADRYMTGMQESGYRVEEGSFIPQKSAVEPGREAEEEALLEVYEESEGIRHIPEKSSYEPSDAEVRDLMRLHGMGREEATRYLKKKQAGEYDAFYGGDWWRTGKEPPKSYSRKEAAVLRHLGYEHPNINEKQLAKLRRQVMRSFA